MQKIKENDTVKLKEAVVHGILKKKGKEVMILDLQELENPVCRFFVLCHGESNVQVDAIAESVEETVKEEVNEKVWHREGLKLAQWVLLDYGDLVVHIFQKPFREFYNLEGLWAEARKELIEEEINLK